MSPIDPQLAYELMRDANAVLLKRNKQLAEALNDMLLAKPTPEQRANAFSVLCAETGQQP